MPLSDYAVESLGFETRDEYDSIEAEFYALVVFEVRGFTLAPGEAATQSLAVGSQDCLVGVGNGLNEICQALCDDDYCDDEAEWARGKKASPPFVLVRLGPTAHHVAHAPRLRFQGENLVTYDAFSPARNELTTMEGETLPAIETALSAVFSEARTVVLRPVDRTRYGSTAKGRTVIDIHLEFRGSAYVSTSLGEGELNSALEAVARMAPQLPAGQAKFFQAALRTADPEKRFLYLFISLEREVHRVFKTLSHEDHIERGLACLERVSDSLSTLLENRLEWRNVADRFVWCVASVWTDLGSAEIDDFRRLKRIRDGIAHGSATRPSSDDIRVLESLARRVLLWE